MTSGYIGFDPTSDSLHIGSLVPILYLYTCNVQAINHMPWWVVQPAWWATQAVRAKSETC